MTRPVGSSLHLGIDRWRAAAYLPEHHARRCFRVKHAGHIRETAPLFSDPEILPRAAQALPLEAMETWGDGARALLFAMLAHHGRPVGQEVGQPQNPRQHSGLWRRVEDYDPLRELAGLTRAARAAFPGDVARVEVPVSHRDSRLIGLVRLRRNAASRKRPSGAVQIFSKPAVTHG